MATYGEPPRAADWNPSSAKWAGQLWRVERYRAGRADGSPWPALNTAKRPFGGSLGAAVRAAGFEPAKPGPVRRADVDPAQAHRALISPEGRAMLAAALAQARAAEQRVLTLERRLERLGDRALRLTAERDAARQAGRAASPAKPTVVRERVLDQGGDSETSRSRNLEATVARAQRRVKAVEAKAETIVRAARDQTAEARMDAAEARTAAKRMAARLERAEATIGTLRGERRQPRGEVRALTAVELAELRTQGPSGPGVMAAALTALATARRTSNPTRMRDALRHVAQAAVTWQERI
ncbi:MAG TPA: hypothetical protein VHZ75_11360 [Solirubrobacteraceae bacterium]|nr:hypothetical protein [Solirubrobacteraceae bacterium]